MKKYLVIGNPISHSWSPKLHNYWFQINNIEAIYEKQRINEDQLKNVILKIKEKKISGINVTVPFKKKIITYLDLLTPEAKKTQSVNTVCLDKGKLVGHNTDIKGFQLSIKDAKFDLKDKDIFILGAGGVVPSLILALNKMGVASITLSNRSRNKAETLKQSFNKITIIDWGKMVNFDMVINATSVGLNKDDKMNLNFSKIGKNKFFYDVIYNPKETNFLKIGKKLNNKTENGEKMFIYQALEAFKIWHGIQPEIDNRLMSLLKND